MITRSGVSPLEPYTTGTVLAPQHLVRDGSFGIDRRAPSEGSAAFGLGRLQQSKGEAQAIDTPTLHLLHLAIGAGEAAQGFVIGTRRRWVRAGRARRS